MCSGSVWANADLRVPETVTCKTACCNYQRNKQKSDVKYHCTTMDEEKWDVLWLMILISGTAWFTNVKFKGTQLCLLWVTGQGTFIFLWQNSVVVQTEDTTDTRMAFLFFSALFAWMQNQYMNNLHAVEFTISLTGLMWCCHVFVNYVALCKYVCGVCVWIQRERQREGERMCATDVTVHWCIDV